MSRLHSRATGYQVSHPILFRMTPYQVGKAYIALKAHFTKDSYDVIRSNGRINYPRAKFEERKDRHRCEKMAINMRDDEIVKFFVANFSRKPDYSGLFDD